MSATLSATAESRRVEPLPEPLTPLLGRASEVGEALRLIASSRLVTLTGAGGSGKTRLALEVAHRVAEEGRQAVWVDVAPLTDGDLLPQQLGLALHLRQAGARDALDEIVDTLRGTRTLIVLDNCEHLVDDCARLAERILRSCPDVTILATSREPLGVAGEQTWLVPPLANRDAVQLFAERARAVLPVFALEAHNTNAVEIICARLDGIPLAIELAAARVKVLAVWQIVERLNDAFKLLSAGSRTLPRHRTIYETIDWSFRLLSADEQTLFRRLAVFPVDFSLAAAEAICAGDTLAGDTILDLLSALVDKSLVVSERTAGKARYRLLETVRQFAMEKLAQAGERDRFRDAHGRWFFALAEAAEPRLFAGAGDAATMTLIDDELANLRALFEWMEADPSRAELELRLVYALHWYWFARGQFAEGSRRIGDALSRTEHVPADARARGLIAAGDSAIWQGEWRSLGPIARESTALVTNSVTNSGNLRLRALSLMHLGIGEALGEGDPAAARATLDAALDAARAHGRDVGVALVLHWYGLAAVLRNDFADARAAFEEAAQIGADVGHKPAVGHPSSLLGFLAIRERRYDEAAEMFARALDVFLEIDDRWGLTHVIEGVALLLLHRGDRDADRDDREIGTRLLAAASAAWLQLGARPVHHSHLEEESDARIREAMNDERLRIILASGASMSHDDTIALLRKELADLTTTAADAAAPSASSVAPLIVRALGTFEIVRDGAPIDAAGLSLRAREMLVFLLINRGACTKEQIGAALWPDADASRLRNNFHVTLHRLRKILGEREWVLAQGDSYSMAKGVEFDVDLFEREVKAKRYDRAVALYRGDFLANVAAGEWADEVRDRLKHQYASALAALGRTRIDAGDLTGAVAAYERLFTVDPLDEAACRGFMSALARSGDANAATRVYKQFASALRRELDAEPEPATATLHARIATGEFS
jgi:predicted ATPase/DNA-binding SARP family transcriptional activator